MPTTQFSNEKKIKMKSHNEIFIIYPKILASMWVWYTSKASKLCYVMWRDESFDVNNIYTMHTNREIASTRYSWDELMSLSVYEFIFDRNWNTFRVDCWKFSLHTASSFNFQCNRTVVCAQFSHNFNFKFGRFKEVRGIRYGFRSL